MESERAVLTPSEHLRVFLLTGFGTGRVPVAPGTVGTLPAAFLAAVLVGSLEGTALSATLLVLSAVLYLIGIAQTKLILKAFGTHDPGSVVLDEIVGMLLAVALVTLFHPIPAPATVPVAFVLFRVFDIWKPEPVRRLEALPGATGVMADDVMAGVYAGALTTAAHSLGAF